MYLNCCHRRLLVDVGDDLRDDQGHTTSGLFSPQMMTILIDRTTPRDRRRSTLVHELGHAYEFVVGRVDPNDCESRQNRIAAIDAQFTMDLEALGGERAIHELFGDADDDVDLAPETGPNERAVVREDEASEFPTAVACPGCGSPFPGRAVKDGKPIYDAKHNSYTVWRALVCPDRCLKVWRWRQIATYDGIALPHTITLPTARPVATQE